MRFVTRMTNQEGVAQVNDLRTSSFEELAPHRLRFSSSQYENQKLSESSQGSAGPGNGATLHRGEADQARQEDREAAVRHLFPHPALAGAGRSGTAGHSQFTANLYDGSDKGEKFYETSAVIGPRAEPGASGRRQSRRTTDKLNGLASWPIAIGYFEPGPGRLDALPTYELSFRFYENGVSSRLYIDYGDFAIRGELKELTFLEEGKCENAPPPEPPIKR